MAKGKTTPVKETPVKETKAGRASKITTNADGSLDYSAHRGAAPTDLQTRFADWLIDKEVAPDFPSKAAEAAFREGVRLAVALRIPFQASPENQEDRAAKAEEREEEAPAKAAPKAKATKAKAKPAPEPEEDADEDADEAPVAAAPKAASRPRKAARSGSKAAPY